MRGQMCHQSVVHPPELHTTPRMRHPLECTGHRRDLREKFSLPRFHFVERFFGRHWYSRKVDNKTSGIQPWSTHDAFLELRAIISYVCSKDGLYLASHVTFFP